MVRSDELRSVLDSLIIPHSCRYHIEVGGPYERDWTSLDELLDGQSCLTEAMSHARELAIEFRRMIPHREDGGGVGIATNRLDFDPGVTIIINSRTALSVSSLIQNDGVIELLGQLSILKITFTDGVFPAADAADVARALGSC
jgi:hypothetical protein